jgi:hypothetical protein
MRRSGIVLAVVVMLVGCEPHQSLQQYTQSKLNHCEGNGDLGSVDVYKGKAYWVNKYAYFPLCNSYSGGPVCTFGDEIVGLKPGDSFVVSDVWCDDGSSVDFQVVTAAGMKGWVRVSFDHYVMTALRSHDLIDHPRKEKAVGGPARIGMTRQQVIDSELGLPDHESSWETKGHLTEEWKYYDEKNTNIISSIVYLKDGVVYMIKR